MALSETSRMDYERLLLENKPSLTDNELRSPDKTVLGFDVGWIAGAEKLVLKHDCPLPSHASHQGHSTE